MSLGVRAKDTQGFLQRFHLLLVGRQNNDEQWSRDCDLAALGLDCLHAVVLWLVRRPQALLDFAAHISNGIAHSRRERDRLDVQKDEIDAEHELRNGSAAIVFALFALAVRRDHEGENEQIEDDENGEGGDAAHRPLVGRTHDRADGAEAVCCSAKQSPSSDAVEQQREQQQAVQQAPCPNVPARRGRARLGSLLLARSLVRVAPRPDAGWSCLRRTTDWPGSEVALSHARDLAVSLVLRPQVSARVSMHHENTVRYVPYSMNTVLMEAAAEVRATSSSPVRMGHVSQRLLWLVESGGVALSDAHHRKAGQFPRYVFWLRPHDQLVDIDVPWGGPVGMSIPDDLSTSLSGCELAVRLEAIFHTGSRAGLVERHSVDARDQARDQTSVCGATSFSTATRTFDLVLMVHQTHDDEAERTSLALDGCGEKRRRGRLDADMRRGLGFLMKRRSRTKVPSGTAGVDQASQAQEPAATWVRDRSSPSSHHRVRATRFCYQEVMSNHTCLDAWSAKKKSSVTSRRRAFTCCHQGGPMPQFEVTTEHAGACTSFPGEAIEACPITASTDLSDTTMANLFNPTALTTSGSHRSRAISSNDSTAVAHVTADVDTFEFA
nr:hypothetical protein CFP56_19558 [Quercus suber]